MQALILIELDDEHLVKETNDLYDRLHGYKCKLMPLPEKKDVDSEVFINYKAMDKGYQCGWNACLEEIEK